MCYNYKQMILDKMAEIRENFEGDAMAVNDEGYPYEFQERAISGVELIDKLEKIVKEEK